MASTDEPSKIDDGITEDQFIKIMLPWAPDLLNWSPNSAILALERQIGTQFNNLAECRRALRHQGLPGGLELSPERLQEGLMAVGVHYCDADVVLSKACRVTGTCGQATLDDVVEALRSSRRGAQVGERNLMEKDGMRVWQRLREEKHAHHGGTVHPSLAASPAPSTRSAASDSAESDECRQRDYSSKRKTSRCISKAYVTSLPTLPVVAPQLRGCCEEARSALPRLFETSAEFSPMVAR